jgi:hypothetical protein
MICKNGEKYDINFTGNSSSITHVKFNKHEMSTE